MKRLFATVAISTLVLASSPAGAAVAPRVNPADWPVLGGDPGGQKFSQLTQITPGNVASLKTAWTFDSGDPSIGFRGWEVTPIVVNGVMYFFTTGTRPFGDPQRLSGLKRRLWKDPAPPRQLRADCPEWLQEIILRCLEPEAALRYPSGAHLAFDLSKPEQIRVTARGNNLTGTSFRTHFKRWVKAVGMQYQPSPIASQQIEEVPIVMVAIPHNDPSDATLYSLRQSVSRSLGLRPGARLAVVTVISPNQSNTTESDKSETSLHRQYRTMLQQWAQPLDLDDHQTSYHVLEASDVAQAIVRYAEGNNVSMIVMGAATHGLQMQRFVATVPIKVAMEAPCTVILVKQALPFEHLNS
mgnify:CR=1 FL=1